MERIDFSQNWNNKLSCNAFSTLRLQNNRKYIVGQTYEISLEGKFLGFAQLAVKNSFLGKNISEFIARIDTGLSVTELKKILKNMYKHILGNKGQNIDSVMWDYLCLQWTTKNSPLKENQTTGPGAKEQTLF